MKNRKHIFIPLLVLIIAGVIGLVWSVIDYKVINKTMSYSYQVIQFDYDGASDGKDPNGNPFNPIDFLTNDVIKDALDKSGLSETYEVSKVRQYVLMENIVPKNIVKEINSYESVLDNKGETREITSSDYHPVRYRFVLYNDLDKNMSSSSLSELLGTIVDTYCEHFYSTYKNSYDITSYNDIYTMENYDYIYQVEVFSNKIRILNDYAKNIYNEHVDFTVDNKSFNDIALKCDQLINSDVSRINNIIILNALSKDIDRLKDYYNYKIESLNYDRTKYNSDLTSVNAQLAAYEKDSTVYVGSGENIVKVESNSSETYDSLLNKQITISNTIARINKDINDYQGILDDINAATGTAEDEALVQNYITKLGNDYTTLENSFKEMSEAYNEKYVTKGTISKGEVKYFSSSIISTSFIVKCIKVCAPIVMITLLGICVYWMGREIKKSKRQA